MNLCAIPGLTTVWQQSADSSVDFSFTVDLRENDTCCLWSLTIAVLCSRYDLLTQSTGNAIVEGHALLFPVRKSKKQKDEIP